MIFQRTLIAAGVAALSCAVSAATPGNTMNTLATVAERSDYTRTGRYEEVERLCAAYAAKWPQAVRCFEFGRTPEGRPMLALVASRAQSLKPQKSDAHALPVLFIQGGIHAGEIDGKDAGFLALRELLENKAAAGVLERITLLFVPVFNVDGHERFGRWNRPNQVGPEEMGWRVTGQNLNLNRDYMKADAPEMGAMLRLLNAWDPILYVDLHVTDGAQFQYDVSNTVEPLLTGDPALQPIGRALLDDTNARVSAAGGLPLPLHFYPSLRDSNDPASGFAFEANAPRYSTGYWALHNRFAMLVETHSWKNYRTRVRVTHDIIVGLADLTAHNGPAWLRAAREADQKARALGGSTVALAFRTTDRHRIIDFKGYAYTRDPSAVSGTLALHFNPKEPQIWHVPLYDDVVPAVEESAPTGGYIIAPAHASWVAERLALHGIESHWIAQDLGAKSVEEFRADKVEFSAKPFEGRTTAVLSGKWSVTERPILKGALFIPIAQAKARLVMSLLEPRAPDSFAAWGFFNAHFEEKEYMEDYVAEDVAQEMLATRPEIAAEFHKRLASDPAFAKDPEARLEFFSRHHPSWDDRLNLYPVMRVARGVIL
jgi:Zinc carboxypeptidase